MLIALAQTAPTAMHEQGQVGQPAVGRWAVNCEVGLPRRRSPPMVAEAAPTVSSSTQDTKTPSPAYSADRRPLVRGGQVAGVVGGVGVPARGVAEGRAQQDEEPAEAAAVVAGRARGATC